MAYMQTLRALKAHGEENSLSANLHGAVVF